jgi:hypothetical protein
MSIFGAKKLRMKRPKIFIFPVQEFDYILAFEGLPSAKCRKQCNDSAFGIGNHDWTIDILELHRTSSMLAQVLQIFFWYYGKMSPDQMLAD